jgi:hypothetical protein
MMPGNSGQWWAGCNIMTGVTVVFSLRRGWAFPADEFHAEQSVLEYND